MESPGQWSKFGNRLPLLSHALHPIVHPWLNQKHDWPELHSASVPFVQVQLYGSIQPVYGCLP